MNYLSFIIKACKSFLRKINSLILWNDRLLQKYKYQDVHMVRSRKRNHFAYYRTHRVDGKCVREYLGSPNSKIVSAIKVSHFALERKTRLLANKSILEHLITHLKSLDFDDINASLPQVYRLDDCIDANTCFADSDIGNANTKAAGLPASPNIYNSLSPQSDRGREWASQSYKRNSYPLDKFATRAFDGTLMRSKGECIWYDNFHMEGIPYRYDPSIVLTDINGIKHTISPDFQILCPDGSFILVEHLGLIHDPDYAERFKNKLMTYQLCGYTIGDKLIVTSDNIKGGTNEPVILEQIEIIKKRLGMS